MNLCEAMMRSKETGEIFSSKTLGFRCWKYDPDQSQFYMFTNEEILATDYEFDPNAQMPKDGSK